MFALKLFGIQNIFFLSLIKVINIFDDISYCTLDVALLTLALIIERGSVKLVFSREIKPLAALYKKGFIGLLSGRRGWYAHDYVICAPFYCISLNKIHKWGGV